MKTIIMLGVILLASAAAGEAMADCPTNASWTQVTDLVSTLTNKTACSAAGQGTQEEHHSNFELWDYKCGNNGSEPVSATCPKPASDPRSKIGRWSVAGDGTANAEVTYEYFVLGAPTETVENTEGPFKVYTDGTHYEFCSGTASGDVFTLPATGSGRVCP